MALAAPVVFKGKELFPSEKTIRTLVENRIDPDGPGAAILVSRNGEPLLMAGYGLADVKARLPITADSLFDLVSVSKHSHSESWAGSATYLLLGPENGITVAVPSNNGDLDTTDLAEEILALFTGD